MASGTDSVDQMISEANALIESVYRDLGRVPSGHNNLSPQARSQIARVNDVLNSVEDNLNLRPAREEDIPSVDNNIEIAENATLANATTAGQQANQPPAAAAVELATNTPPRATARQDNLVVIDLCTDSPKNDDVILVPHIVPGVINVDSPFVESRRRRQQQRSRLAVDNSVIVVENRERSRSPISPKASAVAASQNDDSMAAGGLQCPICMDEYSKRQPTTTKCGHVYCKECIIQAIRLSHKCPICKCKLTEKNLIRLYI